MEDVRQRGWMQEHPAWIRAEPQGCTVGTGPIPFKSGAMPIAVQYLDRILIDDTLSCV